MPFNFIHVETNAGQPFNTGKVKIIPFARSVRFEFPGATGGFIWNRPVSLLVDKGDGSEQVLNIPDMTRRAQIALLGFGLVGGLFLSLLYKVINKR